MVLLCKKISLNFVSIHLKGCFPKESFLLKQFDVQGYILDTMFCSTTIACAVDFTFHFNWLRSGYTLDQNSTDVRFSKNINITYLGWKYNIDSFDENLCHIYITKGSCATVSGKGEKYIPF